MRVDRMLRAAAEVFGELGFDQATTEAIAERAQVSIGSLYQYFPNKEALFEAMAERHLARAREIFELHLTAATAAGGTWEEVVDRAIDAFDYLHRTEPGFRALWLNPTTSVRILAAGLALNVEFAERTEAVLALYAPGLPAARRGLVATVIVEVISGMLFASARLGEERGRALIEETKLLLRRYLEPITRRGGARRAR